MKSVTRHHEHALQEGVIRDDVKDFAAEAWATTGLATYRGIVRCPCGTPVLLHVEAMWRNPELTVLRTAISGESCPDCGRALSPSAVTYAGIYSAGWPLIPATTVNTTDLYHAIALMEWENR